jgi:hypothetical protein
LLVKIALKLVVVPEKISPVMLLLAVIFVPSLAVTDQFNGDLRASIIESFRSKYLLLTQQINRTSTQV